MRGFLVEVNFIGALTCIMQVMGQLGKGSGILCNTGRTGEDSAKRTVFYRQVSTLKPGTMKTKSVSAIIHSCTVIMGNRSVTRPLRTWRPPEI